MCSVLIVFSLILLWNLQITIVVKFLKWIEAHSDSTAVVNGSVVPVLACGGWIVGWMIEWNNGRTNKREALVVWWLIRENRSVWGGGSLSSQWHSSTPSPTLYETQAFVLKKLSANDLSHSMPFAAEPRKMSSEKLWTFICFPPPPKSGRHVGVLLNSYLL